MKFLPLLFLIPFITFAQSGEVAVGDISVSYDERVETETGVLYYKDDALVASEYDSDANGQVDTWLQYNNELVVVEAADTDGDGVVDVVTTLNQNGEVLSTEGEGAVQYKQVEVIDFRDIVAENGGNSVTATDDDLVGSLDRIDIPKAGIPFVTILLWVVILGGAYWFYMKRKNDS